MEIEPFATHHFLDVGFGDIFYSMQPFLHFKDGKNSTKWVPMVLQR